MHQKTLERLLTVFGPEKKFILDGYYRIRRVDEREIEMAYLIADACGASTVSPQITLRKKNNQWEPIKFLDMTTSPTKSIVLDDDNRDFLIQELTKLVEKFERAIFEK